jgi:pantoate--beta-alanine ligase
MVKDLNVPVAIVEVPTVRETDGFALSSRNQQLNAEERRIAPVLNQALRQAEGLISTGARRADEIKTAALAILQQYSEIRVEYLEIVDPENMQPVEQITGSVRIMIAAWIGKTRLIDNILGWQAIQAAGR